MIHYALRCADGHGFDGWFRDSGAFEEQVRRGFLACPACGGVTIERALMAPAITSTRRDEPSSAEVPAGREVVAAEPRMVAGAPVPAMLQAMLQRMRSEIERTCENMGDQFPDEARAIAAGESAPRGIYGNATREQAEALHDEGIEVHAIPWLPLADS